MIIQTAQFTIYFGDNQDNIYKPQDCVPSNIPLIEHRKFASISKKIDIKHLAFLNQVRANDGMIIKDHIPAFEIDGDYLITAETHVGIGVLTADCLPIAIYDQKNHLAAMIHAGWQGTVARIAQKVIMQMQKKFGTDLNNLQIFLVQAQKYVVMK